MRPVKCMNEHFFDADRYAKCPQCGAEMKTVNSSSFSKYENKPAKPSLFSRGRKKKENEAVMVPMSSEQGTFGFFTPNVPGADASPAPQQMSASTPSFPNQMNYANQYGNSNPAQMQGTVTELVRRQAPAYTDEQLTRNESAPSSGAIPPVAPSAPSSVHSSVPSSAPSSTAQASSSAAPSSAASSVADEIRRVSSNNEGKTVGFFNQNRRQKADSSDTADTSVSEPVVGWLVCVKGVHFGESFTITSGRNSIGRNQSNSICLSKDDTVSREKHAWIVFEPRKKRFLVQPGESSGLIYVDGEDVLQPVEIHSNEIIELGGTKLMLVPLCGENFSWEDWMNDPD